MGLQDLLNLSLNALVGCRLTAQEAYIILIELQNLARTFSPSNEDALPQLWRRMSKALLKPGHPFELHQLLFNTTYKGWNTSQRGPPPVWVPTPQGIASTNAAKFMHQLPNINTWQDLYKFSITNPEEFWLHVFKVLPMKFHTPPRQILQLPSSPSPGSVSWLLGARFNTAESALSGHDPDRPAIIWAFEDCPTTIHSMTRFELGQQAQHIADCLRAWGLKPGDAVAVDMPMVPEAVAAFLGIILAGCAAVSIADSFAPREIESRLRIAKAKAIFTQDVVLRSGKALPLYSRVVEAGAPKAVVLPAGGNVRVELRQGDVSWESFVSLSPVPYSIKPHCIGSSDDLSGILFSSGTTGEPKAIPWTQTTPLRCAADAHFHQDVRPEDVVCWPTSMGWMMGPWLVYACLFNGAAMGLFIGSPMSRQFGQFISAARVAVLGLVPSIARAWKATNCMKGLDWSCLRCFSSTGEASAPEEYLWLSSLGGYCPVIEYCGGTEIGGGFLSGSMLQPQLLATFSTPTLGARPVLLVDFQKEIQEIEILPAFSPSIRTSTTTNKNEGKTTGELALIMPQLGVSQRLLNADHNKVYYQGMPRPMLRRHGDEMQYLPGGYCRAHGRVDDTMNLGGIKVSSVELERAVTEGVAEVAEAAAVAVPPKDGGPDVLILFLVLKNNKEKKNDDELAHACQRAISTSLNPLFKVGKVVVVDVLPRTASNKVMRRVLRDEFSSSLNEKKNLSGAVVVGKAKL